MVRLTKIYTKTGDDGSTGIVSGDRVSKNDPRIIAIGDVDELNAAIGIVVARLGEDQSLQQRPTIIQNNLFDLGADLATPPNIEGALRITAEQVNWLETFIDEVNEDLPPLTSFILPGGTETAAHLQLCRAVARRAERSTWQFITETPENAGELPAKYLNRLSDLLFVLARLVARRDGEEILWKPGGQD